jgi:hypothetical protein
MQLHRGNGIARLRVRQGWGGVSATTPLSLVVRSDASRRVDASVVCRCRRRCRCRAGACTPPRRSNANRRVACPLEGPHEARASFARAEVGPLRSSQWRCAEQPNGPTSCSLLRNLPSCGPSTGRCRCREGACTPPRRSNANRSVCRGPTSPTTHVMATPFALRKAKGPVSDRPLHD